MKTKMKLLFEFRDGTVVTTKAPAIVTDTTVKIVTADGLVHRPRSQVKRVKVLYDDQGTPQAVAEGSNDCKQPLPWSLLP